jgi:hypothetical protein
LWTDGRGPPALAAIIEPNPAKSSQFTLPAMLLAVNDRALRRPTRGAGCRRPLPRAPVLNIAPPHPSRAAGAQNRGNRVLASAAKAGLSAGGDGGIRTLDRALQPYNGLANRRLQPLGHVSRAESAPRHMPDASRHCKHSTIAIGARADRTKFRAIPHQPTRLGVASQRPRPRRCTAGPATATQAKFDPRQVRRRLPLTLSATRPRANAGSTNGERLRLGPGNRRDALRPSVRLAIDPGSSATKPRTAALQQVGLISRKARPLAAPDVHRASLA